MSSLRYLRDALVFAPCYIALDWASYIDPVGPFNITPWNPQPALAIVWMMLAGLGHAPAVLATIAIADVVVHGSPGGHFITLVTATVLSAGYAGIAWLLRRLLTGSVLHSTRQLTIFVSITIVATALIGLFFVGALHAASLVGTRDALDSWLRFWIGDAVGILVTAPLLLAVANPERRAALLSLLRRPEFAAQIAILGATLWLIFEGLAGDPSDHFYLLFLPLIWISARTGISGTVVAIAMVQIGVVLGIHTRPPSSFPVVELQALVAALTLTGLYLGMMLDERERAAENLRQSLRLAAAGEMAGAIAHEVNQPLTALANYGRAAEMLLGSSANPPAELRDTIGKMVTEGQRAADVVRRMRDFFRSGSTRLETVAVNDLLSSARRIGTQLARGHDIELSVDAGVDVGGGTLPALYIDRLQVEVVLRNLLSNAVESIATAGVAGGRITVVARPDDKDRVRVIVSDNGPGIAPAARGGLFEPFVSGKPTGMGLGLAVSRAIAEAHGGTLDAVAAGHGEFHLVLPCLNT
jgi:signal transduction histidine kinase